MNIKNYNDPSRRLLKLKLDGGVWNFLPLSVESTGRGGWWLYNEPGSVRPPDKLIVIACLN